MKIETFVTRLETNKSLHFYHSDEEKESGVSVWKYRGSIILTWDEFPLGEYYNEHLYTRNERHVFSTIEELQTFLTENNLKMTSFTP